MHESSDAYDLDLDKCVVNGPKQKNFCGVWRDENHSPNMEASYYLRVISAPTCRWSHQLCMENDRIAYWIWIFSNGSYYLLGICYQCLQGK